MNEGFRGQGGGERAQLPRGVEAREVAGGAFPDAQERVERAEEHGRADLIDEKRALVEDEGKEIAGRRPTVAFKAAACGGERLAASLVKAGDGRGEQVEISGKIGADLGRQQRHGVGGVAFGLRAATMAACGAVAVVKAAFRPAEGVAFPGKARAPFPGERGKVCGHGNPSSGA